MRHGQGSRWRRWTSGLLLAFRPMATSADVSASREPISALVLREKAGGRSVGKGLSEEQVVVIINRALRPLQDLHESAQKNVSSLAMDLVRARDSIKMLEARAKLPFLCSDGLSGSYHVTMGDYQLLPKSSWITTCGWRYGHSNFTRALKVPAQVPRSRVCARCLPDTIAQSMGVLCDVKHIIYIFYTSGPNLLGPPRELKRRATGISFLSWDPGVRRSDSAHYHRTSDSRPGVNNG